MLALIWALVALVTVMAGAFVVVVWIELRRP
jgi:hypothetical protein